VMPGEQRVKVRGVQVHGARQSEATAGQRAAINLGGIEVDAIARGQNLVSPGAFVETRLADATVQVLAGAKPLKHGSRVRFHQGTAELLGRVAIVGPAEADRPGGAGGSGRAVPAIQPGSTAFVRLRLETPAVLARGDRYILRAYSPPITIAGGVILDPQPPRTAIRTAGALERCRRLEFDPATDDAGEAERRAATALVEDAGIHAFPIRALMSRLAVHPQAIGARLNDLAAAGNIVLADDVMVAVPVVAALTDAIVETLTVHHRAQPLSEGIPREELRERLFARGHASVFYRALADLAAAGRIVVRDRVALASHRVELTADEEHARAALERAYLEAGLAPPDLAGAAAAAGMANAEADRMQRLLLRQKVLVRVDTLVFHDEALKRLKREVAALKGAAGAAARIDVATFKERFGVTRKYAIPLLEYLDRERLTRRVGDSRVIL